MMNKRVPKPIKILKENNCYVHYLWLNITDIPFGERGWGWREGERERERVPKGVRKTTTIHCRENSLKVEV